MKVRSLASLIVAAVMVGVTLGGVQRTAAAPTHATVTISLAGWASTPNEPTILKGVLKNFEKKYKNIKVNYQVVNTDFQTVMKTRATAGTAPDVFYADQFWVQDFESGGLLKPLDGLGKKDSAFKVSDFYKSLVKGFTYKGHVYAYPKDYSTLALEYNTDMFRSAHISKPPTTWSQLATDACKLTDKSKHIYGLVFPADLARVGAFIFAAGGTILNKNQTKGTIDNSGTTQAMNFFADLFKKGCAAEPSTVGASWPGEAFGKGLAGMIMEGNWLTAPMQQQYTSIHYKVTTLPKGPKGNGNWNYTVGYAMYNKTKHPKEAWDLISYLTGPVGMKQWVDKGGYLPARKSIKAPPGTAAFVKGAKYSRPWGFPAAFSRAYNNINTDIDKVFKGQMPVTSAVSDMQSQITSALSAP